MNTMLSKIGRKADLLAAGGVVLIVAMLIIPLPPMLLDFFITLNISAALMIVVATMYVPRALDFSSFPTILLLTTLFRLAINVSVTRLILLKGDAGHVVEAFGNFVVGGNIVVGLVIFLILIVIQFVVITNGAGRVAEVGARFTLDAMPGKQMAIDADLNTGQITDEEARKRRAEVAQEADFYGAMDGASKFVKGDAMAGILITAINLLGGIVIGVVQQGMPFAEAGHHFSLLSIGDGLCAQIPALLISVATGILVTRSAGSDNDLGSTVSKQILDQRKAPLVAGVMIIVFGLVPGLPEASVLRHRRRCSSPSAGACATSRPPVSRRCIDTAAGRRVATSRPSCRLRATPRWTRCRSTRSSWRSASAWSRSSTRAPAARCWPASARSAARSPPSSASSSRRSASATTSAWTRTSTSCASVASEVARGGVMAGHHMAMNPGDAMGQLPGIPTTEPAFGLPAVWIPESGRAEAEALGWTVVDAESVVVTHLTEMIRAHASELLTRQETRHLLDQLKEFNAAVVDEIVPDVLSLGEVQRVLQSLLREGVSIRDLGAVLEAIGDKARLTRDPAMLAEYARQALGRTITAPFLDPEGTLRVIALDPSLEQAMAEALVQTADGEFLAMDPNLASQVVESAAEQVEYAIAAGGRPVLLCSARVRRHLRQLCEQRLPQLAVCSYNEISPGIGVETTGVIGAAEAVAA